MSFEQKLSFIDRALEKRKKENRFRSLTSYRPGEEQVEIWGKDRDLINFCSNDYLGLSKQPELIEKAKEFTETYGSGSTASRLIAGTYDIHRKLEEKLAAAFGTEAALLFNSGFQANSTIIGTLTDRHSLILADKLCHNSLLQGALLSRATFHRFDHNNIDHLNELLHSASEQSYNRILIITETVFSMDGDRADIEEIARLAIDYNALLFADDAHAVGVWGERGLGLARSVSGIDILLGTFGKAFGAFGSFVACSAKMRDYLINFCPGFIYTTSLPPPVIGAVDAAIDLIPEMEKERNMLHRNIKYMRRNINKLGYETKPSDTQIIPVIIGDEQKTLDLAEYLADHGILATAIRPPTVPDQSSRIRITLSAVHRRKHIEHFLKVLGDWNRG